MPRGDKSAYTDKQKRQAEHIEEGYEERGVSEEEAERRAWATVNAMTGGGKKSGSGRGKPVNKAPARKGGRKGGKAAAKSGASKKSGTKKSTKKSTKKTSRKR
jgi:plasmid stabilization system protein ParE